MNKKELVTTIANECNTKFRMAYVTPPMIAEILHTAVQVVIKTLRNNKRISIRGFGTIELVRYDDNRRAWNPIKKIHMLYLPRPRIKIKYSNKLLDLLDNKENTID